MKGVLCERDERRDTIGPWDADYHREVDQAVILRLSMVSRPIYNRIGSKSGIALRMCGSLFYIPQRGQSVLLVE